MPKPGADEIVTRGKRRIFRQPGGPGADHRVRYSGKSDQYLAITGLERAINGSRDPINVPDPDNYQSYITAATSVGAPDLSTFSLEVLEKLGTIPFPMGSLLCPNTFYVNSGRCDDPSDFRRGWRGGNVVVINGAYPDEAVDIGDLTGWDEDDQQTYTVPWKAREIYTVGALNFGEVAGPEVSREVVDVVYGSRLQCGDCGPEDDGTRRIYAVTASSGSGSPGLPAEVIYSVWNGVTESLSWAEATITGIGANASPSAIEIVGDKLIVLVPSEGAYYYATLNSYTGAPGSFTKVTSGFVAAGVPHDWYVLDSGNVFICGDAGYIYKLADVGSAVTVLSAGTVTTQNLLRIDGDGRDTIVIVGAAATIIRSSNRGATWATTTTAPATGTNILQAVAVVSDQRWWVGSSQGYLYSTPNGGETWIESAFSGSQSGTIHDLVSVNDATIYMSHSTSTPTARLFSTWSGGAPNAAWTHEAPRINAIAQAASRFTRIAVPRLGSRSLSVAVNHVAIGGLSGGGTDGILQIGVGNFL